jgi:predicted RNA-binding Zn ribbon-like protein
VLFASDTESALVSAVELVNSAGDPDSLSTIADLDAFFTRHGYTGRHDGDEPELAAVRALRPELRRLLTAERDDAAEQVNAILVAAQALPRLVRHDGLDWHIHAIDDGARFDRRLAVETAMAMADVIRTDELSRLFDCADPGCGGLVLDLSRNRVGRFCSKRCANRQATAAFRARARTGGRARPTAASSRRDAGRR